MWHIAVVSLSFVCCVPRANGQASTVISGFPTTDCGTSSGCIGFPEDSCLALGRCSILFKFSFDPSSPDKVPVEIYGTPPAFRPQNFWIAVGFNTEPHKMAGTLVTECVYSNGGAGVFNSRNVKNGYANERLPALHGVIPGNASMHNGILGCTFVLDRTRTVDGDIYDLSEPLFIVAGNGPAVGSTLRQHFQKPYTSADAIVVAPHDPADSTTTTAQFPTRTFRTVLFDKFLHSPFADTTPHPASVPSTTVRSTRPATTRSRMVNNERFPTQSPPRGGNDKVPNDQLEDAQLLSHSVVVTMIMRFLEPPLRAIVDLLNRGIAMRNAGRF